MKPADTALAPDRAALPTAPAARAPTTALAACWQRLRAQAPRTLTVVFLLCIGIGLLLNALLGRFAGQQFVYSFAIGLCCMLLTQGLRLAQALASDVRRERRGLPLDPTAFDTGWRDWLPATLIGTVVGMPAGLAIANAIYGRSNNLFAFGNDARVTLAMTLLGTIVSVLALSSLERVARARADAEAARRLAAENQLRLLQSQLEPHMLFNTLANLRVLIGIDAGQAQAMLDRLIAFLRATLDASRAPQHPLATEFDRIADYLALMAVRMGPRLAVEFDLPAALRDVPVPPLVLQPLVENSIQHGLEPKVGGGRIRVSARRERSETGPMLVLEVRDTGVGADAAPGHGAGPGQRTGFGTAGVRERLATLYGSRAALELVAVDPAVDTEGGMRATLRLPIQASSPNWNRSAD